MDNEQVIKALKGVVDEIYWFQYQDAMKSIQHLIASLSEPALEVKPTTDEESVPF